MTMDITFNIGGAAGQGIDTIGDLLTQVFVQAGFYTFTTKDFESRIRGGYNFTQIRVSDKPVRASVDQVDVIIALSKDAVVGQRNNLAEGGVIIFDEGIEFDDLEACHFSAPLEKTARDIGGNIRMMNAAALGAVIAVINFPFALVEQVLSDIFGRKGEKVVAGNVEVAKAMYDLTKSNFTGTCKYNLETIEKGPSKDKLILTGNKALALGAIAANVKWISSYPMSPSTSVFIDIIAYSQQLKIGAIQTEDEISSLSMAIGASYAGARSMVTTSGGGFALMVEALGFAAMVEAPVVIYNAQRPGPSTGLPTRTEQADLLFMAFSSQGEFPRIILAPKDPLEAFDVATRAFNLADKFQVPVMILGDQYFADSAMNIPRIDVSGVKRDHGVLAKSGPDPEYKRYLLTKDGISPRAFPGDKGKTVISAGNVHREDGHITEDAEMRKLMVQKFMNKIPAIMTDLNPPERYGEVTADITLLTWGSTWGAANEAMETLAAGGTSINQLHFCDVYPLRTSLLREVFGQSKLVIAVEQNITSQFAQLVRMQTGLEVTQHINKYDGRPMTPDWIIRELKEGGIL
ncbi:MAG: 2-oxoacid:acceptor oxidoreductase subunit alpha [Candidatus Thorarchaeota archaeon]|nr:MAG: 2-oxoacid:acceptor oxidoreductase subunit alpha [Candidatus Thorarchaeota archaeon]